MTYTIDLGLSIRVSRVRETGDWDIFLGPLEWARAETGKAHRALASTLPRATQVFFGAPMHAVKTFADKDLFSSRHTR